MCIEQWSNGAMEQWRKVTRAAYIYIYIYNMSAVYVHTYMCMEQWRKGEIA
jgi:hypothetical protein